jgi:hypothetical protein
MHVTDIYFRPLKERMEAGKPPFDYFDISRPGICPPGKWNPIFWQDNPKPPDCPGFEYKFKCSIRCCDATGLYVTFRVGQRATFLYDSEHNAEHEHTQGYRIMSFLGLRAMGDFGCPACRVKAGITQFPHLTTQFPGWKVVPPPFVPVSPDSPDPES